MIWSPERFRELLKINRKVNYDTSYMTDLVHYKKQEYWATAAETLKDKKADCEDYALMKMALLRALGWAKEDLNIAVCLCQGQGHAVLIAATDKEDYVLDNNTDQVLPWDHARYLWVGMSVKGDFTKWVEIVT